MKKIIFSLMFMMAACMGAAAMSFERAQAEALYLTDKMAYELNLNDQQYNDAYEINLDYFLRVASPSDLYGSYYDYRLSDLRCILYDWQYTLLSAADYFLRPVVWRAGGWFFPVYRHYNRGFFYYSHPVVWTTYRGGHSRHFHHAGFYANRRPVWNGGMRGHDQFRPSPGMGGRVGGNRHGAGRAVTGRGYHFNLGNGRGSNPGNNYGNSHSSGHDSGIGSSHDRGIGNGNDRGRGNMGGSNHGISRSYMGRGNSFDGSSSRMSSGSRMSGSRSSSVSHGYSPSRSSSPVVSGSRSSSGSHGYSPSRSSSPVMSGSRSSSGSRSGSFSSGGGRSSSGGSRSGRR